jgi:site-specific DNA-methyltransferase (adenine-specific)
VGGGRVKDYLDKIICGDCLEVMKDIPDGSVDLTVTSPPYDNLRTYNGYVFDFEGIADELYRITKDGGVVVWVVNDATVNGSETGTSFRQALYFRDVCGFNLHDTMIWEKPSFTATGSLVSRYAPVFEYMFVLSKGTPTTFNPIKDKPNKHYGVILYGSIRQRMVRCVRFQGEGLNR